jgi:hypothetical protein
MEILVDIIGIFHSAETWLKDQVMPSPETDSRSFEEQLLLPMGAKFLKHPYALFNRSLSYVSL